MENVELGRIVRYLDFVERNFGLIFFGFQHFSDVQVEGVILLFFVHL